MAHGKTESISAWLECKVCESGEYQEVRGKQVLRDMVCYIKGFGIYPKEDGDVLLTSE